MRNLAGALLLVMLGAGMVKILRQSTLLVHGNLSKQDSSEIVRAVRSSLWREAFPDFSWQTIKRAPRALWAVGTARISEISETFHDRARARGYFRLETRIVAPGIVVITGNYDHWDLKKESGVWTVSGGGMTPPERLPARRKALEEAKSFSSTLSNESRLSLDPKQ
jgi:hypothetical protein